MAQEINSPQARLVLGGCFLKRGIGKHGRAFYADELAGFDSRCRQDVINEAAVSTGCLLCGMEAGALSRGCPHDSYHG